MTQKLLIIALITLSSCTRPTITEIINSEDYNLSCGGLKNSFYVTEMYKQRAEKVIRSSMFWSKENAQQAYMAADVKQSHLLNIIKRKCDKYNDQFFPDDVQEMVKKRLDKEDVGSSKKWLDNVRSINDLYNDLK